jgi:hypothetical protein
MQHGTLAGQLRYELQAFLGTIRVPVERNRGLRIAAKVRAMPEAREFCFGHSQFFCITGFPILAQSFLLDDDSFYSPVPKWLDAYILRFPGKWQSKSSSDPSSLLLS